MYVVMAYRLGQKEVLYLQLAVNLLCHISKAARIVLAIPPTSAASERVFSLLEAMFGKDQDASLSDLIQGALMLRYNKRRVG